MSQRSIDELPQGTPKVDSLVAFADPATGIAYKIDIKEFLKTGIDEGGSFRAPVFLNTPVAKPEDLPKAGLAGELRIVLSTKSIYGWDEISQTWINGGNIAGPAGETLKISASVDFADHLPGRPAVLTTVLVTGTKELYIYDPGNPQASAGPATPAVPEVPGTNPGDPPISPAVPAKPPAGWVALGRIDGPKGDIGPKGDPGLDKGTVEGQILRWSVGLDKWVGGAAPVVTPSGTNTGDTIVWNGVLNRYDSVPLATLLPTATDDKQVFTWDATANAWQASSDLANINSLSFSANTLGEEADRIVAGDFTLVPVADPAEDTALVTVSAVRGYVGTELKLEQLSDCTELATAEDGMVPVWNATNTRWEPQHITSPIIYLGTGAFDPAQVGSAGNRYGMAADTKPDPTAFPPLPGDQYIDLATGNVSVFTGTGGTRLPGGTPGNIGVNPASPDITPPQPLIYATDFIGKTPTAGQSLAWSTTTNKFDLASFIPLFKGTFSVGSNTGTSYTPPVNPKEGDIWVDKNSSPPVFKVYRGGAWVLVNWQTDNLGLLSDLANVNVGASGSPGQGDALIFNQLTEQWESGAVPAHITEYDKNTNYSSGTTVYYKGGLFEAKTRTSGVSPAFQYGDCWMYHRASYSGAGDWIGPISFEVVNVVADATLPPAVVHQASDLRPHWTLQWQDDKHFSVWIWELSTTGWTPGSPLPTAQWHNYTARFTKPNATRIWRNYSTPPQHVGDCVVWIYDDPKGTNRPAYRDFPWILRPIRSDLISMHDVQAENPADQSILIWNTSTSYWESKPNPSYTRAEVDGKLSSIITGLEHEAAVLSRVNDPAGAPNDGDTHIIGAIPTGAWAGHANELARWNGAAWQFQTPRPNEAHLVEAEDAIYHYNGTVWNKVANASVAANVAAASLHQVGDIKQSILTEPQFKTMLGTEADKWVLADGRDVTGSTYATITGQNKVPDLRGAFLRMAGQNAGNIAWNGGTLNAYQEDATARPKTPFKTDNPGDHTHPNGTGSQINSDGGPNWKSGFEKAATGSAGNHTHFITDGGDSETRPKNFGVNFFIKIK